MKKLALLGLLIAAVMSFFALDLNQFLTLQGIQSSQERLVNLRSESPLLLGLAYFALYISVTALSVPGATVLTLAAGSLFGLTWGVIVVSFASTIGATLAFLVSRYIMRDWVQARFGDRLQSINEGIARDGAFYLFTLRLVPIFPFFLINLLMGLTSLRTVTFYWVSQLGMFAATLVYVNAGTQLAKLESLSGILSPTLLVSFALLGVFPLLAKWLTGLLRRRRVYARWQRPNRFDRNLIVIGGGAAGLVSAYIAAAVKASVTLVEVNKMGGDCLNTGCVPSKALIRSAKLAQQIRQGDKYGLEAREPSFSFRRVMERVEKIIHAIEPHDSIERYTRLGVEVVQGYARMVDPWTVEIACNDGAARRLSARSIVIAAGAAPFVPPIPGLEEAGYLTSETMWERLAEQDNPPRELVVLGGGPIGCELAQCFARLGSQVTLIEMLPRILIREDSEVSALASTALTADGVTVLAGHQAVRCQTDAAGEQKIIVTEHADVETHIKFDALICAVGRVARLQGYGLEDLDIATKRTVETNDYLETLYPNIYAAGDVAGPYQFTHTASHQAWYAAVNALFGDFKKFKADYSVIPWTTFIDPEVARVGLNEQEAEEKGIEVEITRYDIGDLDRAIADSADHGFVKVLTAPGKDRILGATIVGEHAGDLLAEFVLAMKHGLGLNKILGTIHTYPTLAEANKFAAGEWKRAHAPPRVIAWLERYHRWKRG